MDHFDKRMVLDVLEDALTDTGTLHGCGVAAGLCGAFYMCGLLNPEEWKAYLRRIPAEPGNAEAGEGSGVKRVQARDCDRSLN